MQEFHFNSDILMGAVFQMLYYSIPLALWGSQIVYKNVQGPYLTHIWGLEKESCYLSEITQFEDFGIVPCIDWNRVIVKSMFGEDLL